MLFRFPPRRSAFTLTCLIVAGLFANDGCKKAPATDEGDSAVTVQAEYPTVGPIAEEIAVDAILAPLAQAAIASRVSAPIRKEYVQRGARVRKGQLLVTLEDRDLQGSALDSKGSLTSAQAAYVTATQATIPEDLQKARLDVDQAKANLDVANRTAAERKKLLSQGAIAGRDTDTAIAAAVQAQAAYDIAFKHLNNVQNTLEKTDAQTAQGQLTSARGRYASAEAQINYANLRSPINGVVTDRPFFPGETASAGITIITVMDTSALLAQLHVAQATAQKLKLGDAADIHIPGVDDPQAATISFISPTLDPGSATVEVWLRLPNTDGRYRVGATVHAVIRGYTVPNALQVPIGAILPADDGSTNVLVIGSDNLAHKRAVKVGIRTTERAQITEGLAPGDNVVTEGGYGLDDGTRVSLGADKDDAKGSGAKSDDDKGTDPKAAGGKSGGKG